LWIDLDGDHFLAAQGVRNSRDVTAPILALLSMAPSQRLAWHESWRQFVRSCEGRGESVEAAVFGKVRLDE
jgi:hypothetical protein